MALTLMYITNNPIIAKIADDAGVDRIFVDMEYIGKDARQAGMDTVKSHHTIEDIRQIKDVLVRAELMVRINPIHEASEDIVSSEEEIEQVLACKPDYIMLPMFKTIFEVQRFIELVDRRAKTMLLVETAEAVAHLNEILTIPGIDEIHIGLNDLHLAYGKKFMFEPLADGTVDQICEMIKNHSIKYGFGGVARIGYGVLPAEYIITEHYRLGSEMAILSRSFCNANQISDMDELKERFVVGIRDIRNHEDKIQSYGDEEFRENHVRLNRIIQEL